MVLFVVGRNAHPLSPRSEKLPERESAACPLPAVRVRWLGAGLSPAGRLFLLDAPPGWL